MTINVWAFVSYIPDGKRVGVFRRDLNTGAETPLNETMSGHQVEMHHAWDGCEIVIRESALVSAAVTPPVEIDAGAAETEA